ncbi:hypothetical protein [Alishewanella longhuensis]
MTCINGNNNISAARTELGIGVAGAAGALVTGAAVLVVEDEPLAGELSGKSITKR